MATLKLTERNQMDFYGQQQQPMSLMTISRGQLMGPETWRPSRVPEGGFVDASDLLTLRILEASERKMLMIKELLSPEEFRSVASNLIIDRESTRMSSGHSRLGAPIETGADLASSAQDRTQSTRSLVEDQPATSKMKRVRFSRSETNLTIALDNSNDIKQSLDKRRKAAEFFLGPGTSGDKEEIKMPALESRFGEYLKPDEEQERILTSYLASGSLGHLFALIWALILWIGECLSLTSRPPDGGLEKNQQAEFEAAKFIGLHRTLNWAPYTRERNMRAVTKRLQADETLAKLVRASRPHSRRSSGGQVAITGKSKQEMITLISRKSYRNRVKLKLIDLERNRWIALRSFGPRLLSENSDSSPLRDHTSVDMWAQVCDKIFERRENLNEPFGELTGQQNREATKSRVDIRFERISIEDHKLIRPEVRLAKRLIGVYDQYELLIGLADRASMRVIEHVSERYSNGTTSTQSLNSRWLLKLLSLLQLKCNLLTRLNMKQMKLGEIWADIKLVRSSNSYRLTSIQLSASPNGGENLLSQRAAQTLMRWPLTMSLMKDLGELQDAEEQVEVLRSLIEIEQRLADELSALKRLKLDRALSSAGLQSGIPAEDLEASRNLANWFDSLNFSAVVRADCSSRRLDFGTHLQNNSLQMDELHQLEVASSRGSALRNTLTLARPVAGATIARLELDIEIEQKSRGSSSPIGGLIFSRGRPLKRAKFEVPIRSDVDLLVSNKDDKSKVDHYQIKLELAAAATASDDEDEDKVDASDERNPVISIEFSVEQALDAAREVDIEQLSRRLLVDRLYATLFKSDHSRHFDTGSKSAKLINQIEPTFLLSLMSEFGLMTDSPKSSPSGAHYCLLDPFMPHFRPPNACHRLANFRPASLRMALLSRRWTKLIARNEFGVSMESRLELDRVFLSERENRRKLLKSETQFARDLNPDLIHERLKARLQQKSSHEEMGVARGIEQKRAAALEYIRRLDLLIGQLLETRSHIEQPVSAGAPKPSDSSRVAASNRSIVELKREQLLIEPTIRFRRPKLAISVDVLLLVRSLVPKPTARRPLMPRRRRQDESSSLDRTSRLAQFVRRARSDSRPADWLGESLTSRNQLRLIVTIQRASNVPYRLVSSPATAAAAATFGGSVQTGNSLQTNLLYPVGSPAFARSSSPLFSPSPMMMLAGGGTASPLPNAVSQTPSFQRQQQQTSHMLMPATTYVEANFQRRQLASSLAQGKNPAWNETLFFEVMDEDKSNDDWSSSGERQTMHLADECLQLNLYDCRSFIQDADGPLVETYDLVGPTNQAVPNAAGGGANRLLVARRRIERHLIGSLSVPMGALLTTSGRVEGSFSLSQPLLLDNYQHEPMDSVAQQAGAINQERHVDRTGELGEVDASGCGSKRSPGIHLSVFITLDPPVSFPLGIKLPAAGSHERRDQFELAQLWERIMMRLTPRDATRTNAQSGHSLIGAQSHNRTGAQSYARSQPHVRALVLRHDARYCLISRYLRPLSPPRDLVEWQHEEDTKAAQSNEANQDDEDESHLLRLLNDDQPDESDDRMRRLARFVSLLSPLKYGLFKIRALASGLWFDSNQLLSDHLGGPEEKAVLLCNYFLHMGKCSGLALGESLTSGRCVYVLVWPDRMRSDRPQANPVDSQQVGAASNSIRASNFLERLPILVQTRNCHLWDPNSGCRHKLGEFAHHDNLSSSSLPLVSISSIVTPENVYANLQSAPVNRLDLDPRQRSHWFPLFSSDGVRLGANESEQVERNCALIRRESRRIVQTNSRRKRLAQLEQLARAIGRPAMEHSSLAQIGARDLDQRVYESYTTSQCQQLRDKLERTIKSNLLTWRPTRPTYFNRTLSRIIADKLASFERNLLARNEPPGDEPQARCNQLALTDPDWWRAELADLLRLETSAMASLGAAGSGQSERRLISWPVNLAYTSLEPIIDGLFASGVHNADLLLESSPSASNAELGGQSNSAQFLVAVHVEAYPARVMSVWLFVGVIVTVK